jgi:antitoxin (DNA-binding transcriptional repressor) of toxin-antitoxin stability system
MKVSAQYAETHLDQLLDAAKAGEEVEIAAPDRTSFRIELITQRPSDRPRPSNAVRVLGAGRGELRVPSEDEWTEMDKQLEQTMKDDPLATLDQS